MEPLSMAIVWLLLGSVSVNVVFALNMAISRDVTAVRALIGLLREIILWPWGLVKIFILLRKASKQKREHSSW